MPTSLAGFSVINCDSFCSVIAPLFTRYVYDSANEVSSPLMPLAASFSAPFSCAACGAWSVTIASTVPSCIARTIASLSLSSRSGGLTFAIGSPFAASSSVAAK